MKRVLLSGLLLASPAFCDIFGISDAIYWAQQLGLMTQQLNQARAIYSNAMEYKRMFDQASAFVHNPAQFMASIVVIEQAALNTASAAGVTSQQRAAQLQKIIRAQQEAVRQAERIQQISHQNMSSIGDLAKNLAQTSNELAMVNQQIAHESRVSFYQSRDNTYQPQAGVITGWRLK